MKRPTYYIGIDVSSATFTSAVGSIGAKWQIMAKPEQFSNDHEGFALYLAWLQQHSVKAENAVVCMEATGVYTEVLAHFLVAKGYKLAIEPPLKVKRAFHPEGHKSDPVDSRQISEYAYRFWDELRIWAPRQEVLEQIKTLLTAREQFVVEKAAHHNALQALRRKVIRTPLAEAIHELALTQLKENIRQLEAEIRHLIDQDPTFRNMVGLLMSIPGVGLLLAAHLLVTIQSAPMPLNHKTLAAFIGICPYEDSSGTSIHHKPTSRHYGPPGLRKLLFLAAMSVKTHHPEFRHYFLRKSLEGKAPKLIINNIANKLLKIAVAVLKANKPFIPGYRSINPRLLNLVLTMF
jgi:transposase